MPTREDWIIVYLSISLMVVQYKWLQAEKRTAYLQGQADLYAEQANYDIDKDDPIYTKVSKRGDNLCPTKKS